MLSKYRECSIPWQYHSKIGQTAQHWETDNARCYVDRKPFCASSLLPHIGLQGRSKCKCVFVVWWWMGISRRLMIAQQQEHTIAYLLPVSYSFCLLSSMQCNSRNGMTSLSTRRRRQIIIHENICSQCQLVLAEHDRRCFRDYRNVDQSS